MGIGVEGRRRVRSRDAARDGRARPLAPARARRGRRGGHRRGRPAPADSRRAVEGKDHRARPVGRSRHRPIRSENQNVPLGEIDEGDTTYLLRSQGQFRESRSDPRSGGDDAAACPVYLRDIAEVKDTTEDLRSFTRINGKPGVRLQVTKQSGKNTVAIADAVRAEIERINREMPGAAPDGARRPVEVHRALDRRGEGARLHRRVPRHRSSSSCSCATCARRSSSARRSRFRSSARSRCSTSPASRSTR